ncbi:MAG: glycosyltransferase family 2 protein [Candidatus Sericytochromatia bacterium]
MPSIPASDRELLIHWLGLRADEWESQWQSQPGEDLRRAIAAKPWQQAGFPASRELLDQAIARVVAHPADWAAHLLLRYHGRSYAAVPPAWLAPWLTAQTDRLLQVLPPVSDLTPTVLIPTYNRMAKLERAVASVLAQTLPSWRLLIVDDGSRDATPDFCRRLAASDARIRYLPKPANSGLADSYDLLCSQAETELIISLADDDFMMPACLGTLQELFRRFPWIAMAGGGYYQLHLKQGQLMAKQYGPYYPGPQIADPATELQRCGIVNPVFGSGQLLRRSALARISAADPGLGPRSYSCWDWLSTAQLLAGYEVGYSPEIVVAYLDEADTPNTFGMDWGPSLMGMLELLIADYAALFGPDSYPSPIIEYFLGMIVEPALVRNFHKALCQQAEAAEMDGFITRQRPVWESHRRIRAELLPRHDRRCLIDEHSTSGLTGGNIPGLAEAKAPSALQQLIRSLLRQSPPA